MRVFLAPAPQVVAPLDSPARDAWLLDRSLGDTMARELAGAGLEVVSVDSLEDAESRARNEPEGAFVILDSVLASRRVVRGFVAAAQKRSGPIEVACALPRGLAIDMLSHLDGLEPRSEGTAWSAPFYFLRGSTAACASAEPLLLPYTEKVLRFPIPPGVDGRSEHQVGISESYLCNVGHWVHVLRVNMSAVAGWWFDRLRWGVILGPAWVAWRMLCGFPWIRGRLNGGLRSVSWKANVHHTAHVELSVIQKGVNVGAHTSIRNSFIGEGAQIGEGARIFGSVIGKGAFVGTNAIVFGSVVYPEAFAAQFIMQASLLGWRAAVFTTSTFFDVNFARNVRVAHKGGFADSGVTFLGACVGPNARVAAGVWVGSGREIPSGALVIKPPGQIVQRIGALEKGVAYTVRDSALVRVDGR
jgi:carbonic anhydrase/acetyltransferase-like protein (isoleucine patch superfamily)